jgi:signal transduction histidine kinase
MQRTLRVLVAADGEAHFDLVTHELRAAGYLLVASRVDSAEAIARQLDEGSWDVVVSDWHLRELGAAAVVELVRDRGLDLPVIVVAGTVGEDTAGEAMKCGARDFLVADRLARLAPVIDRELADARARRERANLSDQLLIADRMTSVGLLAAGVAHEINNPLAAVLANLDLAHQDGAALARLAQDTARVRELLDELADAREAAVRIRDIVRDLKLFSRAGDDTRAPVDVVRVLESSLRLAAGEIRHRARLVRALDPVPAVDANESRLGQVFFNLLVNAAQAIPEGRASSSEIRVGTSLGADGRVVVEIGDTGSGMPPEVVRRLFTPFFTTKAIGAGTGLGLAVCHRIVSVLGGEIAVESTPGRGSTFRVMLPPAPARRDTAPPGGRVAPAGRRARILVVDDEPAVVRAATRILSGAHDVVTAGGAVDALALITAGDRFDVILCDLMMPDMTGMELYAELARVAPEQADKVVFLTGAAFTAQARSFLDQVTNPRFEKPFDATSLRAIVEERLRRPERA